MSGSVKALQQNTEVQTSCIVPLADYFCFHLVRGTFPLAVATTETEKRRQKQLRMEVEQWLLRVGPAVRSLSWKETSVSQPLSVKSEQGLRANRLFCPQTLGWGWECHCARGFCSATAVWCFLIGAPRRAARRAVIQQHCWLCWLGGCIHNIYPVSKCGF